MGAGPTAKTSVTITLTAAVAAGPFTITIPDSFATIDGLGAADSFIRNLFVRGGFWASDGNFYTVFQILSISSA